MMASLIRHRDGSLVKESDAIPPEYSDFRLVQFNRIVRGPYARSGLAVVAQKDDIETMIRHGDQGNSEGMAQVVSHLQDLSVARSTRVSQLVLSTL
jgi:hypothetical protein